MSFLRTVKKLVLGETWLLPAGLTAVVAAAALLVRPLLSNGWHHFGGFVLLAGVAIVLVLSVSLSARARRPRNDSHP
jgi:hypothetical protein